MIAATARAHCLTIAGRDEWDFPYCAVPIFNPFKPARSQ
jgi:predicted nucleic acid-binding protein